MAWRTVAIAAALTIASLAACTDDDGGHEVTERTTTTIERPDGPAAELTLLTAGNGVNLVSTGGPDLAEAGYVEEELAVSGTATSYEAANDLPADGRFELVPGVTAEYRSRIVVRRPADEADFNGTVVVEWLNVSGGLDASPDYTYMADELVRGGYAWVGVTAQRIGVEGGASIVGVEGAPPGGLKGVDPERYGDLEHPGDAFAYDLYTQVARALRVPGTDALGGFVPERLLAVGQSQSAFALTTYVDGVQPLTKAFDGFLVHSRSGFPAPLGVPGENASMASSFGGTPTRIRTDGEAPILVLQTESDVLGLLSYFRARQPDDERFRLWEVAGTAHADAYLLGTEIDRFDCGGPINDGPQHLVVKAALRHLDTWVRTGTAPPEAPRLEVEERDAVFEYVRDDDGIVRGGIRTPLVDVPVATLTSEPYPNASIVCILFGSTRALSAERLRQRYSSVDDYRGAYEAAADEAIAAGFVLEDDRQALLDLASPEAIAG